MGIFQRRYYSDSRGGIKNKLKESCELDVDGTERCWSWLGTIRDESEVERLELAVID